MLTLDQFPGPVIEARSGDTLIVAISNQLDDEGVSLHWHGLHMRGANEMDGVVGVTQKAIPAGENFNYRFDMSNTQAGTFW
jgi:FtsP/CotA-like multicopper oxidase with cupredoxin domain